MNIIFFTHPVFLGSQSMPRYTRMLAEGMKERGHNIQIWFPSPQFFRLPVPGTMKKWLGYVDQYILFPQEVRRRLKECPPDTLFVFTDQALGLWIPLVANRFHIIHCHDFLAQQSALGQIPENPVRWTGRHYQGLIRRGYTKGKHFISVSEKTREDLHQFLPGPPEVSEVVYNGLNGDFRPQDIRMARELLSKRIGFDLPAGYLLHVGGNQWYKNRRGVIEIYNAWRSKAKQKLPLLMVGKQADIALEKVHQASPFREDIYLLSGLEDEYVRLAYAGALLFLFPSLAEGFGWPIVEAMACGCPVITTQEAPMSMVAGDAGFLIKRRPPEGNSVKTWAEAAAKLVQDVLELSPLAYKNVVEAGFLNAKRFETKTAIDRIENIYLNILKKEHAL